MGDHRDEKKGKRRFSGIYIAGCISAFLTIFLWIAARQIPSFGEAYAVTIYPILLRVVGGAFSWIPFSAAEILLYLLLIMIPMSLLRRLIRMIRKRRIGELGEWLANLLSLSLILLLIFMLGGGINYYRVTFSAREELSVEGVTREELETFCLDMVELVNREVEALAEECHAVRLAASTDGEDDLWLKDYAEKKRSLWQETARQSTADLGREFASLKGYYPNPKPVRFSELLTVQKITGIYSPFTIEANYNTQVPDFEQPFTICHELSHLKGFMREDEANFIAWLACFHSENHYFRYSSGLEAFCYAGNALYKYHRERYWEIRSLLCQEAEMELEISSAFWHQYDGPVAETHDRINDAYLKANNQKDGVESYGRVVNLMVGYMYRK